MVSISRRLHMIICKTGGRKCFGASATRASVRCLCVALSSSQPPQNIITSLFSSGTTLPITNNNLRRLIAIRHIPRRSPAARTRSSPPARSRFQYIILATLTRPLACGRTGAVCLHTPWSLRVGGVYLKPASAVRTRRG